jgi:predicted deacetylase
MPAEYILRFDDICPTMNWGMWEKIEKILIRQEIDPILAIVPDNQDEELKVDEAHLGFWDTVRSWQDRGWTIGLHGYQHRYVTDQAGLIGIKNRSEFAGLEEHEQESKLNKALTLFRKEQVTPKVWVAPGHSFDSITLRVLKKLKIDVVSDGYYLSPNTDSLGITHVPQQLWRLRRMPLGLWTVCYHHNRWTSDDVDRFAADVQRYKQQITSLRRILAAYHRRERNLFDAVFSHTCLSALQARGMIRKSWVTSSTGSV